MKAVTCKLVGIAPLGFSAPIKSDQRPGERHDAFEQRVWRERAHVDTKGGVIVPPQNLKNSLAEVAKYLSETVPGKGKATFTKHFEAGVMLTDPMPVMSNGKQVMLADVEEDRVFVPSDGVRGSGKRVYKSFPIIREWQLVPMIYVLDPVLMDDLPRIEKYLVHAGQFIGLGWFRPRRNGYYGRFHVEGFKEAPCDV